MKNPGIADNALPGYSLPAAVTSLRMVEGPLAGAHACISHAVLKEDVGSVHKKILSRGLNFAWMAAA